MKYIQSLHWLRKELRIRIAIGRTFCIKAGKREVRILVSHTTEIIFSSYFSFFFQLNKNIVIPCLLDIKGNLTIQKIIFKVTQDCVLKK
jgi:hypothetical protein